MRYIVAIPLRAERGVKLVSTMAESELSAKLSVEAGHYIYIGMLSMSQSPDEMQVIGELNG